MVLKARQTAEPTQTFRVILKGMVIIMFFRKSNKWEVSVKKLQNNEISIQEFVNENEKKTLYYSTPFFENHGGQHPNVLQTNAADIMYFPAFTNISNLKKHMTDIGCAEPLIIKGDLKGVLDSLDSHPLIRAWGVVIDPHASNSIGLPPKIRVQPKCLR